MIDGQKLKDVAQELHMSANAIYLAEGRVLARLARGVCRRHRGMTRGRPWFPQACQAQEQPARAGEPSWPTSPGSCRPRTWSRWPSTSPNAEGASLPWGSPGRADGDSLIDKLRHCVRGTPQRQAGNTSEKITVRQAADKALTASGGGTVRAPRTARLPRAFRKFELLAELPGGGMGRVFKAWDTRLKRFVAIKMIRSGIDGSRLERGRFRVEAEAVARLKHANVVGCLRVRRVGRASLYLCMEFMEAPLDDKVDERLPPRSQPPSWCKPGSRGPCRSPAKDRAPRPETGQRAADSGWHAENRRFRPGQAAG